MAASEGSKWLAERISQLVLAIAFADDAVNNIVIERWAYVLTGQQHHYDGDQFELLLSQYSSVEVEIALLRALADVMEILENRRLDGHTNASA